MGGPDGVADCVVRLDDYDDLLMPLQLIVPLQLFAYYMLFCAAVM